MAGNPLNFTIENRTRTEADIQKLWMFNVIIPKIATLGGNVALVEDIVVQCQSVGIPATTIEEIETQFMGTKQAFPGKKYNGGDVPLTFYETEDQNITKGFYNWHQKIFDLDPNSLYAGGSHGANKRSMSANVYVQAFKYNKTPLPWGFKLYNCWPKSVDAPQFAFGSTEGAMVNVTLRCDYWKLVRMGTNLDAAAGAGTLTS
jgi:hypothetical protein